MLSFFRKNKSLHLLTIFLLISIALVGSFQFADYLKSNTELSNLIANFGYAGAILVGIVTGLNLIVPIPTATFTPIFTTAGLSLPIIIVCYSIGTTLADLLGYGVGRYSMEFVKEHYPKTLAYLQKIGTLNQLWLAVFVLLYSSFAPFPNEAFVIPLALLGVPLKRFLLPMVAGTLIYHTLSAYGVETLFQILTS